MLKPNHSIDDLKHSKVCDKHELQLRLQKQKLFQHKVPLVYCITLR